MDWIWFAWLFSLSIGSADAAPSLTPEFSPPTMAPGASSQLRLNLFADSPNVDVSFTAALPAGLSVPVGSQPWTDCDGVVELSGGVLELRDGRIGQPCSIEIWVTSSTVATHVLAPSDLLAGGATFPTPTTSLDVVGTLLGFTADFSPSTVSFGDGARLTFTLDNTTASAVAGAEFSLVFPDGQELATIPRASTTCLSPVWNPTDDGSLNPLAGDSTIGIAIDVPANSGCEVAFDVQPAHPGLSTFVTSELTYGGSTSGAAVASLDVTQNALNTVFIDDPVVPGGSVTLAVDLLNVDRDIAASDIAFRLELDTLLPGLSATRLPAPGFCGPGSSLTGTDELSFAGGFLPAGATCHFEVEFTVPSSTPSGVYTTTTSIVSLLGSASSWPAAEVRLAVADALPSASLAVLDAPVGAGEQVEVAYTLQNTSISVPLSELAFTQIMPSHLSVSGLPLVPCGSGSSLVLAPGDPSTLALSGGSLSPSSSCTFNVTYDVAVIAPATPMRIATGVLYASTGSQSVSAEGASAFIEVISAPDLRIEVPGWVNAGDTVTMSFSHFANSAGPLPTDISFSADLDAWIPGTIATALPSDPCGVGSTLSGTSTLTLTGGALDTCLNGGTAPDGSPCDMAFCSFDVEILIPASTPSGLFVTQTSPISASIAGRSYLAPPGEVRTVVGGIDFTASFNPSIAAPGSMVDLTYTLLNADPFVPATDLDFTDDFASFLPGASVVLGSVAVCGGTLDTSGSIATLTGGSLAPLGQCSFTVTLLLPIQGAETTWAYESTPLTGQIGGYESTRVAYAVLEISSPIVWEAEFVGPIKHAGEVVTMQFMIRNTDPSQSLTAITFDLDLDQALPGLTAAASPTTPCGLGSTLTGTSTLQFSGGSIPAGDSCVFSVDVLVPSNAPAPGATPVTTSVITGQLLGQLTSANPVTAVLRVPEPCRIGYRVDIDGIGCVEIDECAEDPDLCHDLASCTNSPGSFACTCNPGYTGDGFSCADADECTDGTCDPNAVCTNLIGDFECFCPTGWEGDGLTCDIVCGDGLVLQADGEPCDDGNFDPDDGCDPLCQVEAGWFCGVPDPLLPSLCDTVCGDGIIVDLEICDDGNQDQDDGCDANCAFEPGWVCTGEPTVCNSTCGDGLVVGSEGCDGAGAILGCTADCQVEDGFVCAGEPSICEPSCGNGDLDPLETCDDGALNDGDGCDSACQTEAGWVCSGAPSVCEVACGNGEIDPGEDCDDGALHSGDGCDETCQTEPGWACDELGCLPVCGDGQVVGDEVCDDGDTIGGDGCSADCLSDEQCAGEDCEGPGGTSGASSTGCDCDARGGIPVGALAALTALVGLRRRRSLHPRVAPAPHPR